MFPVAFFNGNFFPPSFFPPGSIGEDDKDSGSIALRSGKRERNFKAPIIEILKQEPKTAFEKAFIEAQLSSERVAREHTVRNEIKSGRLQGVGEVGRLSDEDLRLIILLLES